MIINSHSLIQCYKYSLVLLIMLLIIALKYVYNLPEYTDIKLWDESIYLSSGRNLLLSGLPDINYAPLYAVYSYLLSLFQRDAIKLYYMNYIVMTVLMPLVSYVCFRTFGIGRIPAFILSIIMLLSPVNYNQGLLGQKVSLFTIYILMLSSIWIRYVDKVDYKLFASCLSLLLASFARPEMMLSFIFLFLIFAAYSTMVGIKHKNYLSLKLCLGIFSLMIILFVTIGLPMISKGGGRTIIAFGQHFSYNWVAWTGSDMDPWTNWEKIFGESFGTAKTVREAFTNNPTVFGKHIMHNITSISVNLINLIKYPKNLILPGDLGFWWDFPLVILLALMPITKLSYRHIVDYFKGIKLDYVLLIYAVAIIIPGVISCILIYPRNHYLLPLFVLLLTCAGILMSSITYELDKLKLYILYGVMFVFAVPCLNDLKPKQPYLENKNMILAIQDLKLIMQVNLLEIDGGYSLYQLPNFKWIKPFGKRSEFNEFMIDNKINMIVVSDKLKKYHRLSSDNSWNNFVTNYNDYGFKKIEVGGSSKYILIHNSLI